MSYAKDLQETMIDPRQVIMNNRPWFCTSDIELENRLEYIEEEIASRGGYESMGKLTRGKYELEISSLLDEISYRN
jgi:hypothetical protein